MAVIDAALVLVDGAGNTNTMDMFKPTNGGFDNLNMYLNIITSGTSGSVKLQESDDNSSFSDVAGASYTFSAAGSVCVPFPKTTKRYVKATLTTLTSSNTSVYVGAKSGIKELA